MPFATLCACVLICIEGFFFRFSVPFITRLRWVLLAVDVLGAFRCIKPNAHFDANRVRKKDDTFIQPRCHAALIHFYDFFVVVYYQNKFDLFLFETINRGFNDMIQCMAMQNVSVASVGWYYYYGWCASVHGWCACGHKCHDTRKLLRMNAISGICQIQKS